MAERSGASGPGPALRRQVSDATMRTAMSDPNNKNIVGKVLLHYQGLMGESDLETCGLHALWKTLQYHDASFGQKFTTNLHRFTHWECRRELRRQKNERKNRVPLSAIGDPAAADAFGHDTPGGDAVADLRALMQSRIFSSTQRAVVEEHFFDQRSLEEIGVRHGMSKEAVRKKLDHAVEKLRQLATTDEPTVYSPRD